MNNRSIFILLYVVFAFSCGSNDDLASGDNHGNETVNITYEPSLEVISNPERGFMHSFAVFSEGDALSMATINQLKADHVTLILRLFYLDKFKTSALSTAQLELIETDFNRIREAGIKCVLRFAYTDSIGGEDASYTVIANHLDQLKPLLEQNADVIAVVQAGFIGSWGEWHSSTNNLTTLSNKKQVVQKLLEVLPKEIKIQLRTPGFKQEVFDYTAPIDDEIGYSDDEKARVGFHNDCFLASETDYGTYQDVEAEKLYISKEALYVPTGGETCPPDGIPASSCSTAETEMSLLKWTYLNLDWYEPVLSGWKNEGCFEDFERKLGYRLAMQSANLKHSVEAGSNFMLNLEISNLGFAPVYSIKNSFLVLRSVAKGTEYKQKLDFDVRRVIPKVRYKLEEEVALTGVPDGKYELLIKIEDQYERLSDRPEYCIRLANKEVWEEATGMNKLLHTLEIK